MFAVLEHDTRLPAQRGRPPSAGEVHWDLLVELPQQERLATWRLSQNPIGGPAEIAAERSADHRRRYLDYEGEIGGGRGRVRRLDRGAGRLVELTEQAALMEIAGEHLRGRYEIVRVGGNRAVFRRVTRPRSGPPRSAADGSTSARTARIRRGRRGA